MALASGNSLHRVAETLCISEGAAKYHRHNLYVKLGVSNRQELLDFVAALAKRPLEAADEQASNTDLLS